MSVFIPAIGTSIGAAVPILVTLAIQGFAPALVVLAYAVIYQQIENYWLSPKISADTMSLNGVSRSAQLSPAVRSRDRWVPLWPFRLRL